jgi:hypothetical protein
MVFDILVQDLFLKFYVAINRKKVYSNTTNKKVIYIYIYMCVCVCLCVSVYLQKTARNNPNHEHQWQAQTSLDERLNWYEADAQERNRKEDNFLQYRS